MTQTKIGTSSSAFILFIKSAHWIALALITAMAVASYLFLQQMLAAQRQDQELQSITSEQKALSQRIVMLANTAASSEPAQKPMLIERLKTATVEFETGYDTLLTLTKVSEDGLEAADPLSLDSVFFSKPYHLDYFSTNLAANGRRFISAVESELGAGQGNYLGGSDRARLDEVVATSTLEGYSALSERIAALAKQRLDGLLMVHRVLFFALMGVIVIVAIFIFRPMTDVIVRRTRDLVEARNSMAFQAVHDSLTGLNNRAFLNDQMGALLKGAERRGERVAVVQIDLDHFKQINDTLGHAAGDQVLIATANRLRQACRAGDICVRMGGDEFVLILLGAGTTPDIAEAATRMLEAVNQPMHHNGVVIQPGGSAGIAVYPDDSREAAELLIDADLALYTAKKQGGGGHSFFSEELRRELEHRKRLEADLREAIREEAFDVYFQPQVSLTTSAITGVEALVRWQHANRGMVPPGDFIPTAEKTGLMAAVGRVVIRKAVHEAANWHREGIEFGRLAVNVSGAELREADFDTFLFRTLGEAGLPVHRLALEIVESVILDDEKTGIAAKLRRIRESGIHLELDDFGTGYASLSHVNPGEIDRLKIDRRFVQNIDTNSDNHKIVKAVTDLARGLGIAIVAEGAETADELDSLAALGCDQVQGYSIAFPMPDRSIREWLRARSVRPGKISVVRGSRS